VYNLIENTNFKVGAMYLEGTKREVVRDLLSLDAGINLRLKKREEVNLDLLKRKFFEGLARRNQFVYVDHQGSISSDEIFDKLNYLAKAEGCDVIVIDPIQAGVNSSDNGAIIEFMDTLLKFAKETDTCVVAVSHMRKPSEENPHAVTEYSLMGSSSINQIAFNTILISRDKMNEDHIKRSATKLQLVKCRRTGNTGEAGWLRYDHETTHMFATSNPYIENQVVSEEQQKSMQATKETKVEVDF
jgi:twinkle protein